MKCETFKHNTRKLWEVINEISGKVNDKTRIIDCIHVDDIVHYKPKEIANAFGSYFGDRGKIPTSTHGIRHCLERIRTNKSSLFLVPCTKQEISSLITNLPNKTSSGHDNISNIILKELCEPLLDILDYVINESLKQGVFPTIMKIAKVVPLYKAGDQELVTNYRPISLLMMISKIL